MHSKFVIGVDIGGTNTDAVLIDDKENILCAVKTPTTQNITDGFSCALEILIKKSNIERNQIDGVFVGTTHATNAILERKDLYPVGVIRIAGHMPSMLPPGYSCPKELIDTILVGYETIPGGRECHGGSITPFSEEKTKKAILSLAQQGAKSLAIIGVFSPLYADEENKTQHIAKEILGDDFPITLSHEVGGMGFVERENSSILNASLKKVMRQGFIALQQAKDHLAISGKLMITQNDGSLIDVDRAVKYPILTLSAGPTNSFIGAARLAGCSSAVIIDIGGTSTDVGLVQNGFAVRSMNTSNIGGVSLNLPMPNVLSSALGGGSIIHIDNQDVQVGPKSIAHRLSHEAMIFGGKTLTLTDLAVYRNHLSIEGAIPQHITIPTYIADEAIQIAEKKILQLIKQMQMDQKDLPVIIVGGAAALFEKSFLKKGYVTPRHADVANAFGAALAEISASTDATVDLSCREETLNALYEKTKQKAIAFGADPSTIKMIDKEIIPYSYIFNNTARVMIRVSGKRI
jgi:N-methylhydantoinase A/oxoprolinase/acetone carboxylase beta subunit